MTNADALIQLVRSLSKNEKRSFRLGKKNDTDYVLLFDLIDRSENLTADSLKGAFEAKSNGAVFNVTVSYLYKLLLEKLLNLRQNQDNGYFLMTQILKAKILFEKSIFPAALDILEKVMEEASRMEHIAAFVLAARMELDYLQYLNMPGISEEQLIQKQYALSKAVDRMGNLYRQSALYELLKHRIIFKGGARSEEHRRELNDLIFSEQNLAQKASDSLASNKLHLLFQSSFLSAIGDYQSASNVLLELNEIMESAPTKFSSYFYVEILENMLENLRNTRRYEEMPKFVEQLKGVTPVSNSANIYVQALTALYSFLPLLDRGDFKGANDIIEKSESLVPEAIEKLNPSVATKISLYISLVNIGLKDYRKAKKMLVRSLLNKTCELPIYRILRLTNLIIHYKMNDSEYVYAEARSLRREIAKSGKPYRMESLILDVVSKGSYALMSTRKRELIWNKVSPQIEDIRNDIFECQLLKIFDFTAWIESEILRIPLSQTLSESVSTIH